MLQFKAEGFYLPKNTQSCNSVFEVSYLTTQYINELYGTKRNMHFFVINVVIVINIW